MTQLTDEIAVVRQQLDAANAQLMSTREQQVVLQGRIAELDARVSDLHDRITETQTEIDGLVAQRDEVLRVLRARAAVLYVERAPTSPLRPWISPLTTVWRGS